MTNPRFSASLSLLAVLGALASSPAAAEASVKFVSIDQDQATAEADEALRQLLEGKLGQELSPKAFKYGEATNRLAEWSAGDGAYLARVTPYVYIAAEMLGADFEVLGTYVSKATRGTTYHSYFVVNREALAAVLPQLGGQAPDLDDLLRFIRERAAQKRPARFVYHSAFSTSSYFLPALFFRRNSIFSMPESRGSLIAIGSKQLADAGSTDLVKEVAAGGADFAAVWDGTKVKFAGGREHAGLGESVHFIQLPNVLPNDLLVCSRALAKTAARKVFPPGAPTRLAVGRDDFEAWVDIHGAAEARDALAGLRWLARDQRLPVTVRIQRGTEGGDDKIPDGYLEAAGQAARLSGTELVLYDASFHRIVDYEWTLHWVREGHIRLRSEIPSFGVAQEFRISFQPAAAGAEEQDLTQRIGNILASRLHRMRQVWPYENDRPLVIRDVPFSVDATKSVRIQKVEWKDPLRNDYAEGRSNEVRVESADFYRFRLDQKDFRLAMDEGGEAARLDPMSPLAYRVLLERKQEPQTVFHVFNVVFFALVGLSGTGTVLAFRRSRRA